MTRRLLIVSPRFPPVNAPDHQRVRQMLPWLASYGWEPVVMAVDPDAIDAERDDLMVDTLPKGLETVVTSALDRRFTRLLGLGSLALRAYPFQRRAGNTLLGSGTFDAVLFSTTEFPLLALGPEWKRRYGVPYVVDLHDPWVLDEDELVRVEISPGGSFKYGFAQWLARRLEPGVMRNACHIVSVSPVYSERLRRRYPDLPENRFTHLPFSAPLSDWRFVLGRDVPQTVFDPADGNRHWVFVGRVNPQMAVAVRVLLQGVGRARAEGCVDVSTVVIHFIGTNYHDAENGDDVVMPVARELGVEDIVKEVPHRIGYFEALACLRDADCLIVLGSAESGYVPSKLHTCLATGRPVLSVLHRDGPAAEIAASRPGGALVTFSGVADEEVSAGSDALVRALKTGTWLRSGGESGEEPKLYSDEEMTAEVSRVLEGCISTSMADEA
jgi:glycosyltransferase involved in cell wall biosynthesis